MKKTKIKILAAVIFLGIFGGANFAFAATFVSGDITTDTTWTKAGSPYIITTNIKVNAGVTLTVEPGVIVKLESCAVDPWQNTFFDIYGRLVAEGVETEKIYFTSAYDDSLGGDTNGDGDLTEPSFLDGWMIRFFNGPTDSIIKNAVVRYGSDNFYFRKTRAVMDNVEFYEIGTGVSVSGSILNASNLKFTNVYNAALDIGFGSDVKLRDSKIDGGLWQTISVSKSKLSVDGLVVNEQGIDYAMTVANYSTVTIASSTFNGGLDGGIGVFDFSTINISSSTIKDFVEEGIFVADGSYLTIENSIIQGNENGIILANRCENCSPLYKEKYRSFLTARGNAITDNNSFGFYMTPTNTANAANNWWGHSSGPKNISTNPDGLGDLVSDGIDFIPWLTSDPFLPPMPICCSSVIFLPGLEASRLYASGTISENQLWEPNTNNDVRVLGLDPITGESVNTGIYTDDVIDEAFSVNVYKNFLSFMENMVTTGDITDFETFPYDWRFDVKDVVNRAVAIRGGSYEMIPRLREIANASKTGKVTLIAHSNGGLVAKELLNALKNSGEENLVDRIILVATPELGTPKAVLEMLHGMEPFAFNFPREEVTRELAENMKSAYTLLPSAEYFNRLGVGARPIIEFSTTTTVTSSLRGIYGNVISSYSNLRKFILGDNGARPEPPAAAVNLPNVLKEPFLAVAETRHGELDAWQSPAGIDVIEIIGWGLETPRGIVYKSAMKNVCNADLSVCSEQEMLDPEPLLTAEGDGTVVYLSADALGGERYYVNMAEYNKENFNRNHKSILEITPLQNLVATLVRKEATTTLPTFTFTEKPDKVSASERLKIAVHSPVALHIYDSFERHTGPITNPDLSSDIELSEEQIPNSYYWRLGEGQYAGAGGTATTTVKLVGTALGSATVGIERIVGDETIISSIVFEDIPITAGGLATIDVIPNAEPTMFLDVDGDGIVDAEITPDGLSSENLVAILKGLIKTLDLPDKKAKQLLKVIDKLEKELAKERKKEKVEKLKTKQAFKHLLKLIEQYQKKKILSADEANELLGLIEDIMSKVIK